MNASTDIDDLIVRQLTGELTESEMADFENRLKSDASFAAQHKGMAKAWEASDKAKDALHFEAQKNSAWQAIQSSMPAKSVLSGKVVPLWKKAMRVAAIAIPVAVILTLSQTLSLPHNTHDYFAQNAIDTILLPDNSMAILGKGSKLTYHESNGLRNTALNGVATFYVSKDKKHPFIVNADMSTIRVLGTTFTVENLAERGRTRVQVEEGRVAFSTGSERLELTAGQEAICADGHIRQATHDHSSSNWRKRIITFQQATLNEVSDVLLNCYPELKRVIFNCDSDDSTRITTKFDNQPIEEVVDELNVHYDKKLSFDNGILTISD